MRHIKAVLALIIATSVAGCGTTTAQRPSLGAPTCPASLATATTTPPDLPDNRSVGRGSLVFRPCPTCGARLLTENGDVYNLPALPVGPTPPITFTSPPGIPIENLPKPQPFDPMYGVRLSPDGRWLLRPRLGGMVLRDLTGTTVRDLAYTSASWAWSDDGRWLVVNDQDRTALYDVDSDRRAPIRMGNGHNGWWIVQILSQDEVLLQYPYNGEDRDHDPHHETYVAVDPTTGQVRREFPVSFGDAYEGRPEGRLIVTGTPDQRQVVFFDLFQGRETTRHDLPAGKKWWVARLAGDVLVLIHTDGATELYSYQLNTGDHHLTCTLPPNTELILRH